MDKKKNRIAIMKNKKAFRKVQVLIIALISFCIIAFVGVAIAHAVVFRRYDYNSYDSSRFLTHADVDHEKYPYETLQILSGNIQLTGFLYGAENTNGLIIISPGHADTTDIKLYETLYFVDAGWTVLCYDYTGCYNSQGSAMNGYTQTVYDLDAVLQFVESEARFEGMPVMLFGHSLGAYASAAVLSEGHAVAAAVVASGFDTPKEQWTYSIERFTGPFHYLLEPITQAFIALKYGEDRDLSAVDGINSVTIPVLVISGRDDEFYGDESPIYEKRAEIVNPACEFMYMDKERHDGHYDYFLTDAAQDYREALEQKAPKDDIDKFLYTEHDLSFMNRINDFLLTAIEKQRS
jgi:predicted alpha/beta hydrolase